MKIAVIVFPGSNCDKDIGIFFKHYYNKSVSYIWYEEHFDLNINFDLVILPGGFSFGDYLRSGAIASSCKIINSIKDYAKKGGKILGICNGFQILTECGLLEGSLIRNSKLKYICKSIELDVGNSSIFKKTTKQSFSFPISNADGSYYADLEIIKSLEDNGQILFYYKNDVNGSIKKIAGITSKNNRIFGMMPHPEREFSILEQKEDGKYFFDLILS